jgi:SAM-dependent methyltransferase
MRIALGAQRPVQLLPRDRLVRTGPVDHADWTYRPVLGAILRLRFDLLFALLPAGKSHRLLEVGYGSGVLMPELAARCRELHGADVHPRGAEVAERLAELGIGADLRQAGAEHLPYPDGHFDTVVAMSSLEFVDDIDAACAELRRVLAPGGRVVVVTPGRSALTDLGLRMLTGASARADYGDRRARVDGALGAHFAVERHLRRPRLVGAVLPLYHGYLLRHPA